MGPAVELDADLLVGDLDLGGQIQEVSKDLASLGIAVAAHALGDASIEAAGDDQQGHVKVDL